MNFVPKHEPTAFHTIYFCLLIFLLYLHERNVILQILSGSSSTYRVISNRFVAYQLPGSKLERELEVRALTWKAGGKALSPALPLTCLTTAKSFHLWVFVSPLSVLYFGLDFKLFSDGGLSLTVFVECLAQQSFSADCESPGTPLHKYGGVREFNSFQGTPFAAGRANSAKSQPLVADDPSLPRCLHPVTTMTGFFCELFFWFCQFSRSYCKDWKKVVRYLRQSSGMSRCAV